MKVSPGRPLYTAGRLIYIYIYIHKSCSDNTKNQQSFDDIKDIARDSWRVHYINMLVYYYTEIPHLQQKNLDHDIFFSLIFALWADT